MTKSSQKKSQKVLKTKQRPFQLKDKENVMKRQQSQKRMGRSTYFRSKVKVQRQKIFKQEDQQAKFCQNSSEKVESSDRQQDDFGLKIYHKKQDECIKKMGSKHPSKMFYSDKFEEIEEQDLLIYLKTLSHLKISGVIIANEYGKIIYSDKMGHELFQGSLNKFGTLKVQNLLLKTLRGQNLEQLKQIKIYNENTIFKWIIYSKNNKRRYSNVPFDSNKNNLHDIYFRFLKCLTIRIRPIRIKIRNFNLFQGLWNYQNLEHQSSQDCFMLEVKHSSQMPSLDKKDILNDPILQKYINSNSKKLQKLQSQGKLSFSVRQQKNNIFSEESISSSSLLSIQKKHKERQQNIENHYRRSQIKVNKQQQRKNTSLKQPYGVCLITEIFFDEE